MGWKSWPYWLRGSLIGIAIGCIISLISIYTIYFCPWNGFGPDEICLPIFYYLSTLMVLIVFFMVFFDSPALVFTLGTIFHMLSFAIFGALIGWIYGKIKSKK